MNARLIAIIAGFVAINAHAADHSALSTVDVRAQAALVVDCRNQKLPGRDAVAEVLGTNNAGAIYAGRETLVRYAHRECMHGAGHVAFVRDGSVATPSLALASR